MCFYYVTTLLSKQASLVFAKHWYRRRIKLNVVVKCNTLIQFTCPAYPVMNKYFSHIDLDAFKTNES